MTLSSSEEGHSPSARNLAVLITPNVFQNCHSGFRHDFADFARLLQEILDASNIRFYITQYDLDCLEIFNAHFELIRSKDLLALFRNRVIPKRIDECIADEARLYDTLSVCDALRIATAMQHQLDAVITWEPSHFVVSDLDRQQLDQCRYFDFVPAPDRYPLGDTVGDIATVRLFSVRSFWSFLQERGNISSFRTDSEIAFFVEDVQIRYRQSLVGAPLYEATVWLQHSQVGRHSHTGTHETDPVRAVKEAIDGAIAQHCSLPHLEIRDYALTDSNSLSALRSMSRVQVTVEWRHFEVTDSCSDVNPYKAIATCYCKLVNLVLSQSRTSS
jgi:hypothetical protein